MACVYQSIDCVDRTAGIDTGLLAGQKARSDGLLTQVSSPLLTPLAPVTLLGRAQERLLIAAPVPDMAVRSPFRNERSRRGARGNGRQGRFASIRGADVQPSGESSVVQRHSYELSSRSIKFDSRIRTCQFIAAPRGRIDLAKQSNEQTTRRRYRDRLRDS